MSYPVKTPFRKLRYKLGPSWLTQGEAGVVGYTLDLLKDGFLDRLWQTLLARFPSYAPSDALVELGHDRRVVEGLFETDDEYRVRLRTWLDDNELRGHPFALLEQIAAYLGPGVKLRTVNSRGNWFTRDTDGTESYLLAQGNWNWSGVSEMTSRWSRFWVIVYPPASWLWDDTGNAWGAGSQPWGADGLEASWGSTAPADQIDTVRGIIDDWKPEDARCVNIIVAFDPASFDPAAPEPDGLWEHWSKVVAGVRVPARLDTARYCDGV